MTIKIIRDLPSGSSIGRTPVYPFTRTYVPPFIFSIRTNFSIISAITFRRPSLRPLVGRRSRFGLWDGGFHRSRRLGHRGRCRGWNGRCRRRGGLIISVIGSVVPKLEVSPLSPAHVGLYLAVRGHNLSGARRRRCCSPPAPPSFRRPPP